ncbi:MAG TPA: asparaginase [Rhodospirillaceae bacterium]|nr:asparaginase [Rhodospirillaceae bacterium]
MNDVCILATGGTIDKVHDPIAEALAFSGESHIPEILEQCRTKDVAHQVIMFKDSRDINDADREIIFQAVKARPEKSIVVTHGTSTMSMTAQYLKDRVIGKTVVLTGAMRPFSFFESDAGYNLGGAIVAARALPHGIYIVMNGRVFEAGKVSKDEAKGVFVKTD